MFEDPFGSLTNGEARPRPGRRKVDEGPGCGRSRREGEHFSLVMKNVRNNFLRVLRNNFTRSTLCRCAVAVLPLSSVFYTLPENVLNPASGFVSFSPRHPFATPFLPAGKKDGLRVPPAKSSDAKCVWRYPLVSPLLCIMRNFPSTALQSSSCKVARVLVHQGLPLVWTKIFREEINHIWVLMEGTGLIEESKQCLE